MHKLCFLSFAPLNAIKRPMTFGAFGVGFSYSNYWKCNTLWTLMTVCCLVGRSVCHNFRKWQASNTALCSSWSTCFAYLSSTGRVLISCCERSSSGCVVYDNRELLIKIFWITTSIVSHCLIIRLLENPLHNKTVQLFWTFSQQQILMES